MRRRLRQVEWRDVIVIGGALVVALVLGYVVLTGYERDRQLHGLSVALDAQRRQAQDAGQTPVARPPGAVRASPDQPTVAPRPGPSGPAGAAGLSIVGARVTSCRLILVREDGREYDAGPVCGADGARGPTGTPGPAGSPGPTGAAGSAGQPGKDGAAGPAGPAGPAGKDGADGKDGEPPASYTIPVAGVLYRCDRDPGSPDSAPTYTCSLSG